MMSLDNRNLAYDLSVFEEVKVKKKDNILRLPKEELRKNRRAKVNPLAVAFLGAAFAVSLLTILTVIHNQIKLTELTAQIQSMNKQLMESESIHTQLAVRNESNFSLSKVEEYAKNELQMCKTTPSQVEYINLFAGDKAYKNG